MKWWGIGVALIASFLIIACWTGGAEASVEGTVDFGPDVTYSGTIEFYLVFHNTGDRDVVLTYAEAVIDWPFDSFSNMTDPDQTIVFLEGSMTVPAGETVRLEKKVGSGFYGSFQVHITVVGKSVGDAASTTLSFEDYITFEDDPGLFEPSTVAILTFFIFFGGCMLGFFFGGIFWDFEIRKNMEEEELDGLQYLKWFPHIWWRRGMWLYTLLYYFAISLVFALVIYLVFSNA